MNAKIPQPNSPQRNKITFELSPKKKKGKYNSPLKSAVKPHPKFHHENPTHISENCEYCIESGLQATLPVPAYHFYGDSGEAEVELKIIADGKELERWVGVTPGYCFKCHAPYFTTNQHRGQMHSTLPPPHSKIPAANSYKKRTLSEAIKYGKNYQKKSLSKISEAQKKSLRQECKNYVSPPYSNKIDFKNILIPEFHTWLNKAKRLDNRLYALAKKLDAVLKSNLAVVEYYAEFNILTRQIYDEITKQNPNDTKINRLKGELKSIPGPVELEYETILKNLGINRSTAHGGGFTGQNAWQLFKSPDVCKFLLPKKWKLNNGHDLNLGSDYAVFRFQNYMANTVKELKLSSYPGTLCDHQKKNLEILIAENGRERCILFPNHIPLRSDHYRSHLPQQLKSMGDLIPSERGTERKNQQILQIQRNISSKIPDLDIRAKNVFFRTAI